MQWETLDEFFKVMHFCWRIAELPTYPINYYKDKLPKEENKNGTTYNDNASISDIGQRGNKHKVNLGKAS